MLPSNWCPYGPKQEVVLKRDGRLNLPPPPPGVEIADGFEGVLSSARLMDVSATKKKHAACLEPCKTCRWIIISLHGPVAQDRCHCCGGLLKQTSAPAVILSRVVCKTDRALCVCKYRHCCCRTALMRPATRLRLVCNTNIRLTEVDAWLEKLLLSVVTSSCDDFVRLLNHSLPSMARHQMRWGCKTQGEGTDPRDVPPCCRCLLPF